MKTNYAWALTGYKPITHYWDLFSEITDINILRDTFEKVYKDVKKTSDPQILAEFTMVLNHCCWDANDEGDLVLSRVFCKLYEEVYGYSLDNLQGKELTEYLHIVD